MVSPELIENHLSRGLNAGRKRPCLDSVGGEPLGQIGIIAPEHDFRFNLGHVARVGHVERDVAACRRRAYSSLRNWTRIST